MDREAELGRSGCVVVLIVRPCPFVFRAKRSFDAGVFSIKPFHSTGGIDQLLFPGKKWMAGGTNFDPDMVGGRTGLEFVTARATGYYGFIFWMNAFFHDSPRSYANF